MNHIGKSFDYCKLVNFNSNSETFFKDIFQRHFSKVFSEVFFKEIFQEKIEEKNSRALRRSADKGDSWRDAVRQFEWA